MRYSKTVIFLLLLFSFFPVSVLSEAGDNSEESGTASAEGLDFTVSIDARVGAELIGIIPGVSAIIGVPMSLSTESVSFTPQFGFIYYFDIMTDVHNEFYIPLGLNVLYNPYSLGLDLLFYPAVGGSTPNNMLSIAAVSELELLSSGSFMLLLDLKFGSAFIFEPSGSRALGMIHISLIPRFKL